MEPAATYSFIKGISVADSQLENYACLTANTAQYLPAIHDMSAVVLAAAKLTFVYLQLCPDHL